MSFAAPLALKTAAFRVPLTLAFWPAFKFPLRERSAGALLVPTVTGPLRFAFVSTVRSFADRLGLLTSIVMLKSIEAVCPPCCALTCRIKVVV